MPWTVIPTLKMFFNIAVRRNQMNAIARPMPLIVAIGAVGTFVLIMTGVIGPILAAVIPTGAELENSQEKHIAVSTTQPQQNLVAVLDDDVKGTSKLIELMGYMIEGVPFRQFVTCDQLIEVMTAGQRFRLYILDYELDQYGAEFGTFCIPRIRTLHPGAVIIGRSGSNAAANEFKASEANDFINKASDPDEFVQMINNWLK
jgi:hypothetical protein